jgi:type II secretory pathway pseudopilin PulG
VLAPQERQQGFGVLGAILVVAIMSFVMLGYTQTAMQQHEDARVRATAASINQLASAQLNHYADESATHFEQWAVDVQTLLDLDYLPAFRNINAVGNEYTFATLNGGLQISTAMSDPGEARRVAFALGSHANVVGAVVTVSYPAPGTLSVFDKFLRHDGSKEVTGVLEFGTGASLDLKGNDLANAGTITATHLVVESIQCTNCSAGDMNPGQSSD